MCIPHRINYIGTQKRGDYAYIQKFSIYFTFPLNLQVDMSEYVRVHISTLPPRVYSTCTCLPYLKMYTLPQNVYMRIRKRRRIHEILLIVGKRTSLPWYSTCMCLHHIYGI